VIKVPLLNSHRELTLLPADTRKQQMGSRELTESLSGLKPQAKVLYISGYTDRMEDVTSLLSRGHAFIEKPFTSEDLLRKIRDVLAPTG